eukprot:6188097-Pleurochrysis_carterae.AAC.1
MHTDFGQQEPPGSLDDASNSAGRVTTLLGGRPRRLCPNVPSTAQAACSCLQLAETRRRTGSMSSSQGSQGSQKQASAGSGRRTARSPPVKSAANNTARYTSSSSSLASARSACGSYRESTLTAMDISKQSALPQVAASRPASECSTAGNLRARSSNSDKVQSKITHRCRASNTTPTARHAKSAHTPTRVAGAAANPFSARRHKVGVAATGRLASPTPRGGTPPCGANTANEKDVHLPAIASDRMLFCKSSELAPSEPYPLVEGELPSLRSRSSRPRLWSEWFDEMKQSLSSSTDPSFASRHGNFAAEPSSARAQASSTTEPVWTPDSPDELVAKREAVLARAAAAWSVRDSDDSSFGSSSETCSQSTSSAASPGIVLLAAPNLPLQTEKHGKLTAVHEHKSNRFAFLRRPSASAQSVASDGTADPDDLLPLPEDGSPFFKINTSWPENRRKWFHPTRFGGWEKRAPTNEGLR